MATDLSAVVFMSWGRWVARCPTGCGVIEQRGRCDDGTIGGLGCDRFTCRASHGGCGLRCGVAWPADIADLERVLLARPIPANRNWTPGQTLLQLVAENAAHGILPAAAVDGPPRDRWLLQLVDGELVTGELQFTAAPQQIGA